MRDGGAPIGTAGDLNVQATVMLAPFVTWLLIRVVVGWSVSAVVAVQRPSERNNSPQFLTRCILTLLDSIKVL